jgi:hypothetical protein
MTVLCVSPAEGVVARRRMPAAVEFGAEGALPRMIKHCDISALSPFDGPKLSRVSDSPPFQWAMRIF